MYSIIFNMSSPTTSCRADAVVLPAADVPDSNDRTAFLTRKTQELLALPCSVICLFVSVDPTGLL